MSYTHVFLWVEHIWCFSDSMLCILKESPPSKMFPHLPFLVLSAHYRFFTLMFKAGILISYLSHDGNEFQIPCT